MADEKLREEKVKEILDNFIDKFACPMCYRLNPQHKSMDYGKGCHWCQDKEDWLARLTKAILALDTEPCLNVMCKPCDHQFRPIVSYEAGDVAGFVKVEWCQKCGIIHENVYDDNGSFVCPYKSHIPKLTVLPKPDTIKVRRLTEEEMPYKEDGYNDEVYCDIGGRDKAIYLEGFKKAIDLTKKAIEEAGYRWEEC